MAETTSVPLIDISPFLAGSPEGKRDVARQLAAACTDIGFFAITGHGVSEAVIDEMRRLSHIFFELPEDEKNRAVHPIADTPRGLRVFAGESLGRTAGTNAPADFKEFYHFGPESWPADDYHNGEVGRRYFIPNLWPEHPAGFEAAANAYYRATEELAAVMMRIAALALDLPEDYFQDKIDCHVTAIRINHYPARTPTPEDGQIRAGSHTDYGLFTILMGEDGPGGLQVQTRRGDWIDVVTRPEFFVINVGDLLMRWTNDVWVSNPHRVTNPPPCVELVEGRVSIGFFQQPNYDAVIECIPSCRGPDNPPRYKPVRSGDYRDGKYEVAVVEDASA